MRRCRSDNSGLGLFAFQDIITGVAGVILFILMLLVVQLTIQSSRAKPSALPDYPAIDSGRLVSQSEMDELELLLSRKRQQYNGIKAKIDLVLDAKVSDIQQVMEQGRARVAQLRSELESLKEKRSKIQQANRNLITNDSSQTILQEIQELEQEIRETEAEILEWKDSTRVNYQTDVRASNLYLFDVHSSHVSMTVLPPGETDHRIVIGPNDDYQVVASAIKERYDSLPNGNRDSARRIIVLIRPSAAEFGLELAQELRESGFTVALELLEAKAELFRKRRAKPDPLEIP
jgi:hypothetical protein